MLLYFGGFFCFPTTYMDGLEDTDIAGTESPAPPADTSGSPEPVAPAADVFLDELDQIGASEPGPAADPSPEASTDDKQPAAPVAPVVTEEKAEEASEPDEPDDIEEEEQPPPDIDDWKKLDPEEEEYINKYVPQDRRNTVRKAYREAKMARSFINPQVPADLFVENLQKKSNMRFNEVESAILRKNAQSDPIGLLGKVFESTKDEAGNSEPYKRLLDGVIATNPEYAVDVLKRAGYDLAPAAGAANVQQEIISDAEIDAFTAGDAFGQLKEVLPEDATKLEAILASAKQARARVKELESKQQDDKPETDEKAAAEEAIRLQAQQRTYEESFQTVYEAEVTTPVNSLLDKDYGLAVTAEEKERSPLMAKLKAAKRQVILSGGLEGGDFDNDLYQWGQTRPAFKKAAEALVKYTQAGEKENARAAARELRPFVDMFLKERVKSDDVKFIDEIIQIVAAKQKADLDKPQDTVPDTPLVRTATATGGDKFLDELDAM
jgi:hypothetical protein